jgi:hypothetical protein
MSRCSLGDLRIVRSSLAGVTHSLIIMVTNHSDVLAWVANALLAAAEAHGAGNEAKLPDRKRGGGTAAYQSLTHDAVRRLDRCERSP